MQARVLPQDPLDCGWYATLPAPGPARRLQGDHEAAWVVVGAGFTGLAAARRLAGHHPEERILLLEAQRVGLGSSGRNSGFLVELGRYRERVGLETNRRLLRLGRAGISRLRELVRQHGIDCHWSEGGRLHVAVGDRGRRTLDAFARRVQAMGEACQTLGAEPLRDLTGTSYYCEAVFTPGDVQVQPAALARGLAAALPSNVELYEDSPVQAITEGVQTRVDCPDGSVRAGRVVLATNAFTPAFGLLKRRVFPMLTFASLTRPLVEQEQMALGGQAEWGLISAEPVGSSVRRTRDGRILIRSQVRYGYQLAATGWPLDRIGALHEASFRARFPALGSVTFEYTWGGVISMSANDAMCFGQVRPGIFVLAGDNGHGVAMGTVGGELLADLASDCPSELLDDMQKLPRPAWVPPDPFLKLGVEATSRFMHWRGRSER